MDSGLCIALGCLFSVIVLGISVAIKNLGDTERIERNLEARRAFKKEKNERMRRFYGLD